MFQKNRSQRIGRNDPCPCGSGLKFKKCCLNVHGPAVENLKEKYWNQYKIRLKEPKEIEGIRLAGKLVIQTLAMVEEHIHEGMKTEEINTLVHEFTIKNKGIPAPLNYRGFPKSVCVSVNEVICHGIPGNRVLENGDIVNVDVTTILNGYYADASKTFFVGNPGKIASKIVRVASQSLKRSLKQVKPGNTLGDIGHAIQSYAESQKCTVVREFVGHGVGLDFHEAPQVPHYGKKGEGIECVPGMVFTIEPMINYGKKELKILPDKWTAVTLDNSLSAQFEQTILVTPEGYESLTPYPL
jgi:methionyl aminopeptidase